jgi:DNA repair protein RecO
MEILDRGFIINVRPFSNTSVIAKVFSHSNGVVSLFLKGGLSKKSINFLHHGNLVDFKITKRLDEHIGTATILNAKCYGNMAMIKRTTNNLNLAICEVLDLCMLENEPETTLFDSLVEIYDAILNNKEVVTTNFTHLLRQSIGTYYSETQNIIDCIKNIAVQKKRQVQYSKFLFTT